MFRVPILNANDPSVQGSIYFGTYCDRVLIISLLFSLKMNRNCRRIRHTSGKLNQRINVQNEGTSFGEPVTIVNYITKVDG